MLVVNNFAEFRNLFVLVIKDWLGDNKERRAVYGSELGLEVELSEDVELGLSININFGTHVPVVEINSNKDIRNNLAVCASILEFFKVYAKIECLTAEDYTYAIAVNNLFETNPIYMRKDPNETKERTNKVKFIGLYEVSLDTISKNLQEFGIIHYPGPLNTCKNAQTLFNTYCTVFPNAPKELKLSGSTFTQTEVIANIKPIRQTGSIKNMNF